MLTYLYKKENIFNFKVDIFSLFKTKGDKMNTITSKKFFKILICTICTVFLIVIIFILSHLTPQLAIKTNLLFSGNFSEFYNARIQENDFQYNMDKIDLDKENARIYNLTNISPESPLFNFKVRKVGFLYISEEHGEA